MRFTPKTEAEIAAEGLIPNGTICDFEVLEAEEKQSKAGNDMIALKLKVWRPDGSTTMLRDWLVSNFPAKILGFAKSTSMLEAYEAGAMPADSLPGRAGKLKVKVEDSAEYGPQNKVGFYMVDEAPREARPARGGGAKPGARSSAVDADEIPFLPETRA